MKGPVTRLLYCALPACLLAGEILAQQVTSARPANEASIFNRADARAINLQIPAPRGLITDRHGKPLAQSVVVYELVIQFPQLADDKREIVIDWARKRLALAKTLRGNTHEPTDDELFNHYKERRWLPFVLSSQIKEDEAKKLNPKLSDGLTLQATYSRIYPQDNSLAHVIGYVGRQGKSLTGPISTGEPLFQSLEGRAGLEKVFDKRLSGRAGSRKMLFDSDGTRILDEMTPAETGQTIVTTIDLKWQKIAEDVLEGGCRRGAFVVIDIDSGEVLVLASRPSFDLNKFVPAISTEDYAALRDDPGQPLFGRAFQAGYPPASTFKPVVTLAAISNNTVTQYDEINCPPKVKIGEIWFRNWTKKHQGTLNARAALARSANPYFYSVGNQSGAESFLSMARRLGFGKTTGLPLIGETPGMIPTNETMTARHGRRITNGDTANMAIGQGDVLASPLQVAQAMTGLGNGNSVPTLHLVKQIQDINGRVVIASRPKPKTFLSATEEAQEAVRGGMKDVVHAGYGTGKQADIGYEVLCGKTGTAQWNPGRDQRLAWFSGFVPYDNPRYAFVALYEGAPGEVLSGGKNAAPMVRRFFKKVRKDVQEELKPPPVAVAIDLEEEGEGASDGDNDSSSDEGFIEEDEAQEVRTEDAEKEDAVAELKTEDEDEPVTAEIVEEEDTGVDNSEAVDPNDPEAQEAEAIEDSESDEPKPRNRRNEDDDNTDDDAASDASAARSADVLAEPTGAPDNDVPAERIQKKKPKPAPENDEGFFDDEEDAPRPLTTDDAAPLSP